MIIRYLCFIIVDFIRTCKMFSSVFIKSAVSTNQNVQSMNIINFIYNNYNNFFWNIFFFTTILNSHATNTLYFYLREFLSARAFDTSGEPEAGERLQEYLDEITGKWVTLKKRFTSFNRATVLVLLLLLLLLLLPYKFYLGMMEVALHSG